ncbi:MAG: hypothetical protein K5873_03735, partial [Treponema sp.]|nr:hypothetical protein [Treponema sp.]
MKKLNILTSLLLASSLILGTTFVACSDNDDDSNNSTQTSDPKDSGSSSSGSGGGSSSGTDSGSGSGSESKEKESGTDSGTTPTPAAEDIAVSTKGSVEAPTAAGVATLKAKNGTYVFTKNSVNASIRAVTTENATGTWVFKNNLGKEKFSGDFSGEIDKLGTEEVKLELEIEKGMDKIGESKGVFEEKSFEFDAGKSEFEAKIPEVDVPQPLTITLLDELNAIEREESPEFSKYVEWMNKYARNETETTFVAGKEETEIQWKMYQLENKWNDNTKEFEDVLGDLPDEYKPDQIKLKTDGTCEVYGGYELEQNPDVPPAYTGEYILSEDGKYVLAHLSCETEYMDDNQQIATTTSHTFAIYKIDRENKRFLTWRLKASDSLKFGLIKVQYIVDGEEVMLEECSPNVLRTPKIPDNSLSLDKEGKKKITIDKKLAEDETEILFTYKEAGSSEEKNVVVGDTYYY